MKNKKISIQKVSVSNFVIIIVLLICAVFFAFEGVNGLTKFIHTTNQYIDCQMATKDMQAASDYLTEQARLYVMTGDTLFMEGYFDEVNNVKRRDDALQVVEKYFSGTEILERLQDAFEQSKQLTETEYYAMRLITDLNRADVQNDEIENTHLSAEDQLLSLEDKTKKAQNLMFDQVYRQRKSQIKTNIDDCCNSIILQTADEFTKSKNRLGIILRQMILCMTIMAISGIAISVLIERKVVRPLVNYCKCVSKGTIFPIEGVAELQSLAENYNLIFEENKQKQKLLHHQAQHDGLTQLLNRQAFDSIMSLFEKEERSFALHIIDVDSFKSFNDKYGHATGDAVLKKVADTLKKNFRSYDHVCRIGGDEFAVIMVDMPLTLKHVAEEKIKQIASDLMDTDDSYPMVTLSIGVAFSDTVKENKAIFNAADEALYRVKNNGRNGYRFYQ